MTGAMSVEATATTTTRTRTETWYAHVTTVRSMTGRSKSMNDDEDEVVKALISIRDYLCSGNPIWDVDTVREVMDKAIKAVKEQEYD